MATSGPASASAEVSIAATPEAVYALITDLPTLAALAEETHAMEWVSGTAAAPGAVFKGRNRNGAKKWTTKCTVTTAQPGRTFAFDVRSTGLPIAHWRYDITAAEGGCVVTEQTWDRRPGWFIPLAGLATGVSDRGSANAEHIKVTLARLKAMAESGAGLRG